MGVIMRTLIVFALSIFVFGCASVEKTTDINHLLDRDLTQMNSAQRNMDNDYPIFHAQYATVMQQIGGAYVSGFDELSSTFTRMTALKDEYNDRANRLNTSAREQRKAWAGKIKITSSDPEWESLDKFKNYSKPEFRALLDINNQYQKEQAKFNQLLANEKLRPYTNRLPRSKGEANRALKELEKEKLYEGYNKALLDDLAASIM